MSYWTSSLDLGCAVCKIFGGLVFGKWCYIILLGCFRLQMFTKRLLYYLTTSPVCFMCSRSVDNLVPIDHRLLSHHSYNTHHSCHSHHSHHSNLHYHSHQGHHSRHGYHSSHSLHAVKSHWLLGTLCQSRNVIL